MNYKVCYYKFFSKIITSIRHNFLLAVKYTVSSKVKCRNIGCLNSKENFEKKIFQKVPGVFKIFLQNNEVGGIALRSNSNNFKNSEYWNINHTQTISLISSFCYVLWGRQEVRKFQADSTSSRAGSPWCYQPETSWLPHRT